MVLVGARPVFAHHIQDFDQLIPAEGFSSSLVREDACVNARYSRVLVFEPFHPGCREDNVSAFLGGNDVAAHEFVHYLPIHAPQQTC